MRSGAQALILLAAPLSAAVLRAIDEGARQLVALQHATGMPAQTTLRAQLKRLWRIEAIEKQRCDRFPGVLEYELSAAGRDLLFVADATERWLERAPGRPLTLGGSAAKAAIRALAEGWSSTMLRALAAGPRSLTELSRMIGALSYPSLERRLAALRLAGQVEAQAGEGRGTPYAVTRWGREGVGPLAAAALWERRHMAHSTTPLGRVDAEALFLLAAPLLSLPEDLSGSCRMAIELPGGDDRRLAGAVVAVERGRIDARTSHRDGTPDAWALGSATGWLEAMVHADLDGIELGGHGQLARTLAESLHGPLFGAAAGSALSQRR
jgi:DNA-binding HxlR family transcriptional regulator